MPQWTWRRQERLPSEIRKTAAVETPPLGDLTPQSKMDPRVGYHNARPTRGKVKGVPPGRKRLRGKWQQPRARRKRRSTQQKQSMPRP